MKKKQIILLTILGVIVLAFCIGGYFVFQAWNEDVRKRDEEIITLKEEYKIFSEEATIFNEKKSELDKKLNEIYYNTLKNENEAILSMINSYKESKSHLVELGNSMNTKCERYSKKSNLTNLCSSYKTSLETAEKIYGEDITRYQKLIVEYNNWVETHPEFEKIEEYQE